MRFLSTIGWVVAPPCNIWVRHFVSLEFHSMLPVGRQLSEKLISAHSRKTLERIEGERIRSRPRSRRKMKLRHRHKKRHCSQNAAERNRELEGSDQCSDMAIAIMVYGSGSGPVPRTDATDRRSVSIESQNYQQRIGHCTYDGKGSPTSQNDC